MKAEAARLITGIGYAALVYFGVARPPRPELLHAARATTALRMAGLIGAAAGRRSGGLLGAGSAASLVLSGMALADQRGTRCSTTPSL